MRLHLSITFFWEVSLNPLKLGSEYHYYEDNYKDSTLCFKLIVISFDCKIVFGLRKSLPPIPILAIKQQCNQIGISILTSCKGLDKNLDIKFKKFGEPFMFQ